MAKKTKATKIADQEKRFTARFEQLMKDGGFSYECGCFIPMKEQEWREAWEYWGWQKIQEDFYKKLMGGKCKCSEVKKPANIGGSPTSIAATQCKELLTNTTFADLAVESGYIYVPYVPLQVTDLETKPKKLWAVAPGSAVYGDIDIEAQIVSMVVKDIAEVIDKDIITLLQSTGDNPPAKKT